MKFKYITVMSLSLLSLNSAATASEELTICTKVANDTDRLECFDDFAKNNNFSELPESIKPLKIPSYNSKGKWILSARTNSEDDSTTSTLTLISNGVKTRQNKLPYLTIRCKSNTTNAYIGWHDYLGNEAVVMTRFDSNEEHTDDWNISSDSTATFHAKPIKFIQNLLKADKLVTQVTPFNGKQINATFETKGLYNALKPLKESCRWLRPYYPT
jgi:type VI secretion system protein VasI